MNDLTTSIDVMPPQMLASKPTEPEHVMMYLRRNNAGIHIDASSAYKWTASWACIRVLTDTISMLRWHGYKKIDSGGREILSPGNRLNQMLNVAPNDEMTSFSFRETMMANVLVWGNAFAEIERDMSGAAVKLWPIEPHRVDLKRDKETSRLFYLVDNNTTILPEDMFHIKGLGSNGLLGYYVLALFSQCFATGLAAERHAAQFFGEGAIPSGLLKSSARLNETTAKEYIRAFEKQHLQSRRIGLLQPNMDFEVISSNNEDAQLQETRSFQVEEACRIYRVPPTKIGELRRGTYSNTEQMENAFARDSIAPWCIKLEQEANAKLIGPRGKRDNQYTSINLNGILRGDSESRVKYYQGLRDLGVLTPNDILRLEDMNEIGPEGDKRLVPLNFTTLEMAGKVQESLASQPKDTEEEPEDEEQDDEKKEEKEVKLNPRPNAMMLRHVVNDHAEYFERITKERIRAAIKRYDGDDEKLCSWLSSYYAKQANIMKSKLMPVAQTYNEMCGHVDATDSLEVVVAGWCCTQTDEDFRALTKSDIEDCLEQWESSWAFDMTNSFLQQIEITETQT